MHTKVFLSLTLSLIIGGCADYSVNVNEKTVYNPLDVFTDFRVADPELQRCIDQTIKEEKIRSAADLESLLCPQKSIQSLAGIEVFSELKVLGLENNRLEDTRALVTLNKLEQLNLANSGLTTLTDLPRKALWHYLDLRGNSALACEELTNLKLKKSAEVLKPEHCN